VKDRVFDAPDRASEEPEHAAPPVPAPQLIALQQSAGNAAVARLIARQTAAPPKPAVPAWATQAEAEATAAATRTRLYGELIPHMRKSKHKIEVNTVELFTGPAPMLTFEPITKRSDSDAEVTKPGVPGWVDPKLHDAFFTGLAMTNTRFHQKDMAGTLDGPVMLLRGHDSSGNLLTLDTMASHTAHEVSHFFVKRYGEMPDTDKDDASIDRYRDEFRAYWIETERWWNDPKRKLTPKQKAEAIRTHLVGVQNDPKSGYPNFRKYWTDPIFKVEVDSVEGPEGYNLVNSARLDRLWQLTEDQKAGKATVDDVIVCIDELPPSERAEANESLLIKSWALALPNLDARRVLLALDAPTQPEYTEKINPTKSPKVTEFLHALVGGKAAEIKAAYQALITAEAASIARNPAFMVYVDRHVLDPATHACVYAMTTTGSARQFDAMATFLRELEQARTELKPDDPEVPPSVSAALAALHDYAKWSLFSWSPEAMATFVDALPSKAVRHAVREELRR
jgi:hypothetical protein